MSEDFQVTHDEAKHRYVITVDGEEAGFANYVPEGAGRDFNHTVIDPKFRGQGLSGKLIKAALDDVRASGGTIKATCSAVAGFLEKNPDYKDMAV
ncbi:GNAT family N-acetyltransferase [Corynebacterium epidermidicanis]|uniref:Putative acetyltransferase n=1 Tax=Corynebacterium epidermidicanis TaxID=1050174 RepID=A0A0G3GS04_9CORY|nr:GNAT family N-acetyltransferase [Corynebacterium epidermidicanis]AKK03894.1 putative acetyltransferase [Corynebacterium epidermidicanis]